MDIQKNINKLCEQCPLMAKGITLYGIPDMEAVDTSFLGMVRTVNSQMLSTASARTIYNRVLDILPNDTAMGWIAVDRAMLRTCGLSDAKINTLTEVANDIVNSVLNLDELTQKSSMEIYDALIKYKGIGPWTAKGYALTRLQKEDLFLGEDLGVRDGVQVLLELDDRPSIDFCMDYGQIHWMPYGGTATRLLWHFKEKAKVAG